MTNPPPVDPAALTADLIRCASVTPVEGGALVLLQDLLEGAGFACTRVDRGGIANLYARWGAKGANKSFGFNGHTDVVPVGDLSAWTQDPFGAAVVDGWMYGRGATDMKSGVAAFAAAAVDFVRQTPPDGAVILTITGDEEDVATDGTVALLDWMATEGERMTHCLVGEPTCPNVMGEMMKIGRRGSMTCWFTAKGVQGHSAYPHRAKNPMSALVTLLARLEAQPLDQGTAHFDPSTLAITTIDCGNPANNVIPAKGTATVKKASHLQARSVAATSIGRGPMASNALTSGCTANGSEYTIDPNTKPQKLKANVPQPAHCVNWPIGPLGPSATNK